jgi:hypothetical protein
MNDAVWLFQQTLECLVIAESSLQRHLNTLPCSILSSPRHRVVAKSMTIAVSERQMKAVR